jgi:hypothetical protein
LKTSKVRSSAGSIGRLRARNAAEMGSNVAFSDLNETSFELAVPFNLPFVIVALTHPLREKSILRLVNLEFSVC